jgi:hypothetical protein
MVGGIMIALSDKWIDLLVSQPETGMGYHIVSVILNDGTRFDQVIVNEGYITRVRGYDTIPFKEVDIREMLVTHEKWDFGNE